MYELKHSIKLAEISIFLGLEYKGVGNAVIDNVSGLDQIDNGVISFTKSDEHSVSEGVLIASCKSNSSNVLISSNPRLDFIRCLYFLNDKIGFKASKTPPVIHDSVVLGNNVVVEDDVIIGENSVIEHNVVIRAGTRIGSNCLIRAGAVIGSDGFGFERLGDGTPIKFVHLGGVVIGSHVEIGANTCIAKGTLGNTIIEDNVKIDNLVHIAHNCTIKNGAFIIACSEISGGVIIGENAWIAPNSSITHKVSIGKEALVGLGAVVTKSVSDNKVVMGNPARVLRSTN
ncbi:MULTISPECIES: DapH/DapD/GlmU-related protein [unclassified Shewanella]|uniref:DapH/DapD/GlmU-related protein n=1 Tax=unclassified Shewanella TaxID=196818 RepID=UPI0039B3EB0F